MERSPRLHVRAGLRQVRRVFELHLQLRHLRSGRRRRDFYATHPVIDPDNRKFDFAPKVAFNVGIGLRVFLTRWLAANIMIADYIFPEKLESLSIAPGPVGQPNNPTSPSNSATWLQDGASVTNNVQAQIGISVFLPFSFNYRLPK